ncbi:MAG TPA: peptidylprolyl isomerase [Methanocorpusculum sp.]|nr:peptidylprolyl isomerase [Methanocorpusculum sp.]
MVIALQCDMLWYDTGDRIPHSGKNGIRGKVTDETVLADGDNFAKLAKSHSQCPSGRSCGDLGYFGKGQMVKLFEDTVFRANAGDVVVPVQTRSASM